MILPILLSISQAVIIQMNIGLPELEVRLWKIEEQVHIT